MKRVWNELKVEMPEAAPIIDAGLSKLEEYRSRADLVPAYVVAMGNGLGLFKYARLISIIFKLSIPQ
jgi:hypothetical protein